MINAEAGDRIIMAAFDSCKLTFFPKIPRWKAFIVAIGLGDFVETYVTTIVVEKIVIQDGSPMVTIRFDG